MTSLEFQPFQKIPRWSRDIIITEKIDGTNACVVIVPKAEAEALNVSGQGAFCDVGEFKVAAQSRTRYIVPGDDNYGFAAWVRENAGDLVALGPGRHFGEWWGRGINRKYGEDARHFSLFNVSRWCEPVFARLQATKFRKPDEAVPIFTPPPACCRIVPVLYHGPVAEWRIDEALELLAKYGSYAKPGFPNPEGVVIFHVAGGHLYKKTLENDNAKGAQ